MIIYKTIAQYTVALSTTEAEFYSLTDAGKLVLYVRLVLSDLGMEQKEATKIYEDNHGCLQMAQALKPTRRTRHVEAKYFAILDWVQTDQVTQLLWGSVFPRMYKIQWNILRLNRVLFMSCPVQIQST